MRTARHRAIDFVLVREGKKGDIRMSPEVYDAYAQAIENDDEISVKRRTHLGRYFEQFTENDDYYKRLNDEQFKKEGNFPDGNHGSVAIWTFKAWQWRLYGAVLLVGGKRCFVGVTVDSSKKKNKANKSLLRAAGTLIGEIFEYRA